MSFQPGENWNGNANGRKPGSRNRRTQEILDLIKARGDKDPLDALSEIISTSENPDHRISASNILAPYCHSKRGTLPAVQFIPEPIEVPNFQTIDEAENFLNDLSVRLGKGEIDSQSALELGSLIKQWIDSRRAAIELDLKVQAANATGDTTIRIEGGLPQLPGTNINMGKEPTLNDLNGHNGHVIEHDATPALVDGAGSSVDPSTRPKSHRRNHAAIACGGTMVVVAEVLSFAKHKS